MGRFHYPQIVGAQQPTLLPNPPQGLPAAGTPAPGYEYTPPSMTGVAGQPIDPAIPTTFTNVTSVADITGLPTGLSLNTSNGWITGTPAGPSGPSNYTLRATGPGGTTDEIISIEVGPA